MMTWSLWLGLVVLVTSARGASHPEIWGEQPDQADIDNGQCVPIMCQLGVPPAECTKQCALRHYLPVCRPAGFCLCQHLVNGKVELVSPDEVQDQPPEPEPRTFIFHYFAVLFKPNALPTPEPILVNVHDGRLFWDFRYILSGLVLLMLGLVLYELWLCRQQAVAPHPDDQTDLKYKVNM